MAEPVDYEQAVATQELKEIVRDLEEVITRHDLNLDRAMDAAGMLAVETMVRMQEANPGKSLILKRYFDDWVERISAVAGIEG